MVPVRERLGHVACRLVRRIGRRIRNARTRFQGSFLGASPNSLELYSQAIHKYKHGIFSRNLLDDLRLSLELVLKSVFNTDKSLEKQLGNVGSFVSGAGGSKEFSNMFSKLIDYYAKYQNTYIRHDDGVMEEEIEFVFEISSSFMR
jgi:hypothetical protein